MHAAIAGVYLFLSGLISGYYDNQSLFHRVPERVRRVKWLRRLIGQPRLDRVARYLEYNLGALVGNFGFGIMLGATGPRLIVVHLLPNVAGSVMVLATLTVARVVIAEASLSFLGLGIPPPTPSWGGMLADGRQYLATAWWASTFPGLALMATVISINLLGDWLRDVLDPRLQAPNAEAS